MNRPPRVMTMTDYVLDDVDDGDRVIWGDRSEALTVTATDSVHTNRGVAIEVTNENRENGATYQLYDNGFGDPKVYKPVVPTPDNPRGMRWVEKAEDFRVLDD